MPRYWLFKSEPDCFSYEALEKAPNRRTGWDGVRNYQARNFLRDDVKYGDGVIYYHSNAEPPGIAGIAVVVEESHPDPTQFDPSQDHYDPKSDPKAPTWMQVTVEAVAAVSPEVGLPALRKNAKLEGLELLRVGSRLSVHPVSEEHWRELLEMAGFTEDPHAHWLRKHGLETRGNDVKATPAAAQPKTAKPPASKSLSKAAIPAAKPAEAKKRTKIPVKATAKSGKSNARPDAKAFAKPGAARKSAAANSARKPRAGGN